MERTVLGLTTEITLIGKKESRKVVARVDTGAEKSSVDTKLAEEIDFGEEIKTTTIKQAHGSSTRPVVKGSIKFNGTTMESEFTLADRSHMSFRVLVGQNVLKDGDFLIDPNKGEE